MAKRRDQGSSTCTLILAAILGVLFAAIFVGMIALPVVFFIGYICYEYKLNIWRKNLSGTMNDFWLNPEEKHQFREVSLTAENLSAQNEEMKRRGAEANLSINKDGTLSARSNLGKQIRATLEENTPKLEFALKKRNQLSHQPRERWNSFNTVAVRSKSMPIAWVSWFFAYIVYCWFSLKFTFDDMYSYYFASITNVFVAADSKTLIPPGYITALLVASGVSVVMYVITVWGLRRDGKKYSPIPDEVTSQNIDAYEADLYQWLASAIAQ